MDNEICRDLRLQVLSDRRPSWRSSPNLRIFPSTRISPAVDTDPISTTLTSRGRVISRTSALVLSLLCKSSAIRPIDRQVVVRRGSGVGGVTWQTTRVRQEAPKGHCAVLVPMYPRHHGNFSLLRSFVYLQQ